MACTAKNIFGALQWNACPGGEVHLPCPCHFTHISMPIIPRHKICKRYQYEGRYPTGRHTSWPSLVLHPAGWPQAETSCGHVSQLLSHRPDVPHPLVLTPNVQVWYYCEQAGLQSEVHPIWDDRPGLHLVRCQVRLTSCQMYPLTEKVIWTWKDDWPPWTTSTPRKTFCPRW